MVDTWNRRKTPKNFKFTGVPEVPEAKWEEKKMGIQKQEEQYPIL